MNTTAHPDPRPRRWFWALLATAVLAMGGLGAALAAPPSPAAGLAVLASSLVLLAAATQATRIQLALERTRRNTRAGYPLQHQLGRRRSWETTNLDR